MRIEPGKLEQIVVNFVLNATDAMPDGGSVVIETGSARLAEGAPAWSLSVTDTGVGMDEETRRRVFEPFFTTKPRGRGTGLGLAVVYGIVDRLGGTTTVRSRPGSGTTFRVVLPATDEAVSEIAPGPELARRERLGGRVLVVDDEVSVGSLIRTALCDEGYEVSLATHPDEAIALVEDAGERFDLLISDLVMPGIDGHELVARVRSHDPRMRVILISGQPDPDQRELIARRPDLVFLSKPFGIRKLIDLVDAQIQELEPGAFGSPVA